MATGVDAVHAELLRLFRGARRNLLALASLAVELPAVIAALQLRAVKLSIGERNATVRARISQRKRASALIASNHERNAEKLCLFQTQPFHAIAGQRAVPEAVQQQCVGSLTLRGIAFAGGGPRGYRQKVRRVRSHVVLSGQPTTQSRASESAPATISLPAW